MTSNVAGEAAITSEQATARQIQQLLMTRQGERGAVLDDRTDAARMDELRRLFARLYQEGDFYHSLNDIHSNNAAVVDSESAAATLAKWKQFLSTSHAKFRTQLVDRIALGKRTAVRTFWGVVASSPQRCNIGTTNTNSNNNTTTTVLLLNDQLLQQWIQAMTHIPIWDQSIQHMVQAEFLQPFYDVQYYTMKSIRIVAQQLYQQIMSSKQGDDNDDDNNNNGGKDKKQDKDKAQNHHAQAAERLLQMLVMIPIAQSQQELDLETNNNSSKEGPKRTYLFVPPQNVNPDLMETTNGDKNDDSGSDKDDDDDDDDEEEESDDESSESEEEDEKHDRHAQANQKQQRRRHRFPVQTLSCHRREWSRAWLALLRLPCLPLHCLKQALQFLPQHVLPVIAHPLVFADFFIKAYDDDTNRSNATTTTTTTAAATGSTKNKKNIQNKKKKGGKDSLQKSTNNTSSNHTNSIVPILALDGLFYLMTQHGLEYPKYYTQLYRLIQPTLFTVKFKTRFFQLLDKSVSRNDLLPAYIVAALGKRLLRCCLQAAPPAGILTALALVSNWFRKHPETLCLLHRSPTSTSTKKNSTTSQFLIADKFNATADDPAQANALHSSLWELSALEHHYYPAVATLAKSLGTMEESKLPMHQVDDFLNLSYQSLLEQERKRRSKPPKRARGGDDDENNNSNNNKKKQPPLPNQTPLAFQSPNGLFSSQDIFAGILTTTKPRDKTNDTSTTT
ncbi:hypothetical protein ACA910_002766 [Epithemia clementina (nom. ined.)]